MPHLTTDDAPPIQTEGRKLIVRLSDDAQGQPRFLELPRPSMGKLALAYEFAVQADELLPKPAPPTTKLDGMTEAELAVYSNEVGEVMRERNMRMHAKDSPHGQAFLAVLKLMTGADYTVDDADPYFMNPSALREMLAHWQAPLGGLALADASATDNDEAKPPSPDPSPVASPTEPTPSSPPGIGDSGPPPPAT